MAGDARLPRHHDVVFDRRATGDPDLRREQHAPADRDAVRDVDEVVQLGAGADPRLADGRTINCSARANVVYGSSERRTARRAGAASCGPRMIADALVVAMCDA